MVGCCDTVIPGTMRQGLQYHSITSHLIPSTLSSQHLNVSTSQNLLPLFRLLRLFRLFNSFVSKSPSTSRFDPPLLAVWQDLIPDGTVPVRTRMGMVGILIARCA
jgi:hypothetical protein